MVMIVLDAMKPMTHKRLIEKELEGFGIRVNRSLPDIYFKRKDKGGVAFRSKGSCGSLCTDAAALAVLVASTHARCVYVCVCRDVISCNSGATPCGCRHCQSHP